MPPPALYVFKAARRPRYRRENLRLLAAERGTVVEAAYNRMWIAPELLEAGATLRGAPVHVVFTDRPYERFVPVREGEVLDVEEIETTLRLRVLLRGWIGAPAGDVDVYSRAVRDAHADDEPGHRKFVLRRRDDVVFERFFDDREDEGWRRAVDQVVALSRACEDDAYGRSVFFRPVGLRVGGELHEARRLPLAPGARAALALRFHNPHLTEGDVAPLSLRILASDDARAEAPGGFPLVGDAEIPFEVVGERPELTVEIGPAPAGHTAVTQRFGGKERGIISSGTGTGSAAAPPGTFTGGGAAGAGAIGRGGKLVPGDAESPERGEVPATPGRDEVLRLHDVVFRRARLEPDDALAVLDAFDRLLPAEPRLAESRALLLADRGDDDGAYRILRALDPEHLGDDARFLLFRLAAGRERPSAAVQRVHSLDLAADARFPRLLATLAEFEPPALARLLPPLVEQLAADQLREVVARVGTRVASGPAAARLAEALYCVTNDAASAYTYLDERRETLRLADPIVVDTLLDLAAAGGRGDAGDDLGDDAARRIRNLIERGALDDARALLRKAGQGLGRAPRDRLYHRIADRLRERGAYEPAAEIMVELSWAAAETGDLESATEAVQRARGLWAHAAAEAAGDDRRGGRVGSGARGVEAGRGAGAGSADGGGAGGGSGEASDRSSSEWGHSSGSHAAGARGDSAEGRGGGPRDAAASPTEAPCPATARTGPERFGRGPASAMTTPPDWLREALEHVEAAWRACEPLVEWRRTEEERLREQLRARYLNKRILIAGGLRRQDWIDRLRDLTGAEIDWAERYRDEGDNLTAFAQRIRNGHYAVVVHVRQKSGHEVGNRLKAACEEAGVPWAYAASAGVRGVVEGVVSLIAFSQAGART